MQTTFTGPQRSRRLAVFLLGFSLSGFFDGILLHQILEWHHLLSGLESIATDLRIQVAADGFFHALMYVILAAALVLLLRSRDAPALPLRSALALALYGFAAWHFLDAVLSHWLLGLHRIRMNVENPLAWDLGWLAVFGLVPLLAARMLTSRSGPPRGGPASTLGAWALAGTCAIAAAMNLWPIAGAEASTVTVVMAPGKTFADAEQALHAADARILWMDHSGGLFVMRPEGDYSVLRLLGSGALFVSGQGAGGGCGGYFVEGPPA